MPAPRLNLILRSTSGGILSGVPFPGEVLCASRAGQWFADGRPIPGAVGKTYTIGVRDIGCAIQCNKSQVLTIWHPRDVPMVKAAWVPTSGVLNSIAPDVAATNGQTVRAWVDCVSNYRAEQSTGLRQPVFDADAFGAGLPGLEFDGANTWLTATNGILGALRNVNYAYLFASHKLTSLRGGTNNFVAGLETPNETSFIGLSGYHTAGGGSRARAFVRRTFGQASTNFTDVSGAVPTAGVSYVDAAQAEYPDNILRGRRDGVATSSISITGSGKSEDQDCTTFRIGSLVVSNSSNHFIGNICAVIVASGDSLMSTTDRNRIERYIGLCAGRSLSLSIS